MQSSMTFEGHGLGMKQCHFHHFLDRKEKCGMEQHDVDTKRCDSMVNNFLVGAISPDRRDIVRKLCVCRNISAVMQVKHRFICERF